MGRKGEKSVQEEESKVVDEVDDRSTFQTNHNRSIRNSFALSFYHTHLSAQY